MKHLRVESWLTRSGIFASLRSATILAVLGASFLFLIFPTTGWSEEPPVATATWEVRALKAVAPAAGAKGTSERRRSDEYAAEP